MIARRPARPAAMLHASSTTCPGRTRCAWLQRISAPRRVAARIIVARARGVYAVRRWPSFERTRSAHDARFFSTPTEGSGLPAQPVGGHVDELALEQPPEPVRLVLATSGAAVNSALDHLFARLAQRLLVVPRAAIRDLAALARRASIASIRVAEAASPAFGSGRRWRASMRCRRARRRAAPSRFPRPPAGPELRSGPNALRLLSARDTSRSKRRRRAPHRQRSRLARVSAHAPPLADGLASNTALVVPFRRRGRRSMSAYSA